MQLTLHRFELPLEHRFGISRGSRISVHSLILELSQGGCRGYGEATANAYYETTLDSLTRELEGVRSIVESTVLESPQEFSGRMESELAESPFARCALDEAAWDLHGKLLGKPVWDLWGLSLENLPASNYTIGIDAIDVMVAKIKERPDWPIYKIKLGTAEDLAIVARLREHTDAVFRVDANCGWTVEETIENSRALAELDVEFIEQPLPADDWRGMQTVFERSALPVIADESCREPADIDRCRGCFHGINIKLMKCGGLTPARRMIDRAKALGMKTMVGCMTESTVGISASAQLLPLLDYVDMDGAVLLDEDTASGVRVERGRAMFPDENGTGVRLFR
ncbi:MAG: dipeptide epimerase [Pirellulales bacterium]|nr:dipeptide epimerase [Pirellulales bacterium]